MHPWTEKELFRGKTWWLLEDDVWSQILFGWFDQVRSILYVTLYLPHFCWNRFEPPRSIFKQHASIFFSCSPWHEDYVLMGHTNIHDSRGRWRVCCLNSLSESSYWLATPEKRTLRCAATKKCCWKKVHHNWGNHTLIESNWGNQWCKHP